MKTSSFGYLLKEGARNVYANRLMSFASIGVLMVCLMLIGAAGLLALNVNNMVGYAEAQNEVVIFLEDRYDSEEDFQEMEDALEKMDNIASWRFVSREEALEEEKASWQNAGALLEDIEADILPNAYRVTLEDLSLLEDTVAQLEELDGIDEISAPVEVAGVLTDLQRAISAVGSIIVIVLAVVSVVIISNTIKLTVYSRRKEISIMKFVGATDRFIRLPFVVEGILIGVISALLAVLGLWIGYHYAIRWLMEGSSTSWLSSAMGSVVDFKEVALPMTGIFVGAGTGMGVLGSLIFIRKYLRV